MCLIALLWGADALSAKEQVDTLTVYFRQGYSTFDRAYRNNGERYDAFVDRVRMLQKDTNVRIWSVTLTGSSSPEGNPKNNERLAAKRADNLANALHQYLVFADSVITVRSKPVNFDALLPKVIADPDVPCKEDAIRILQSDATSEEKTQSLMAVCGTEAWEYLLNTHFPDLRSFHIEIISSETNPFVKEPSPAPVKESLAEVEVPTDEVAQADEEPELVVAPQPQPEPEIVEPEVAEPEIIEPEPEEDPDKWSRKLTVKTNAIGWGFLMTNAAVEIDIIENLSFALPVYYSGWNYIVNTVKFRTFMIQPEIRYYIPKVDGLYVGAHFGLGYWNYALGGDWRYQDHNGKTPSIGGGLGIGYATHFKKNPRWGMEFAIGAGAYDAKYDIFYNEDNGPYHKRDQHTTFIGVDNASVSFTYEFDTDPIFDGIKKMFTKKEHKEKQPKVSKVKKGNKKKEGKR